MDRLPVGVGVFGVAAVATDADLVFGTVAVLGRQGAAAGVARGAAAIGAPSRTTRKIRIMPDSMW